MKFLTYKTELTQSNEDYIWITAHNQLFQDDDGTIYLVPRFFGTDGYTIANVLAPIAGNRMEHDIRPAVQHDWDCKYRFSLASKLEEAELRRYGFLHKITKKIGEEEIEIDVCEDIPLKNLRVIPMSFKATNNKFKRMLNCIDGMTKVEKVMIGNAVFLNVGWFTDKPATFNATKIYKDEL